MLYVVERQQSKIPKNQQPYAEYIGTDYKFQLYTGYGLSSPTTEINCQGIAIRIEHDKIATLMCGDIPYNCLSDNIIVQNEYEYIVVPHYASNMSQDSYYALAKIKRINYPIIYVNNKDKLGKTNVDVDNGEHCQNIKKLSSNKVYFTDDDTHSLVNEYICDLTSINSLTKK